MDDQWVSYSISANETYQTISYPLSINSVYCITPSVIGAALNMIGSNGNNNATFYIYKPSSDAYTRDGIAYIICSI